MSKNTVAIQLIQDMVEADLQLAWSHLQDGNDDLALHELANAAEKIRQIKGLRAQGAESARPLSKNAVIEINQPNLLNEP